MANRYKNFRGMYVAAWVWVDLPPGTFTWKQIAKRARDRYGNPGEIEIDDRPAISESEDELYTPDELAEEAKG